MNLVTEHLNQPITRLKFPNECIPLILGETVKSCCLSEGRQCLYPDMILSLESLVGVSFALAVVTSAEEIDSAICLGDGQLVEFKVLWGPDFNC